MLIKMRIAIVFTFSFFLSVALHAQTEIRLDSLMFTENWFNDLEEAKKHPDKVWFLDLGLQKLRIFPKEILQFKNVKRLYLSVNYWPSIPDEIGNLKQLEILDISSNYYLNKLPEGLQNCTALKELIVKDNKLNPGEIDKIKKLMPHLHIITK
jgi:Leucine-rich repeat (LRR) protein